MNKVFGPLASMAFCLSMLVPFMPAAAQIVSGMAAASDGDSLTIGDHKIRLVGIDAPEIDQDCVTDSQSWKCGQRAQQALASLIEGNRVDCRLSGIDPYGRNLANCSTEFLDLNEAMVELGWALAYPEGTLDHGEAQDRARQRRSGIWNSVFTVPSDYRRSQPQAARSPASPRPQAAPPTRSARFPDCSIKGNRNRRGEWIYHLPGMPYYDVTRAEEFFCTEAQAQAAGYRRAIVRR